jgi:hypothetical protein
MKHHKTRCVHCRGKIEFPAHGVGEWIQCPHCSETTVLRKRFAILWLTLLGALASAIGISMLVELHRVHVYRATTAQMEIAKTTAPKRLDSSEYGEPVERVNPFQDLIPSPLEIRRQAAESARMRRFQEDLLSKMRRANDLADDAVWEARRQRYENHCRSRRA